ncbi:hypothetical protein WMY93_027105 [Mugilogobius chulae]|uniref:Uncharacterized protein n=1 Tax=Mugilogobius chulae TaxID=88201 RepID=A0AAW0MXW8_9GOBI
MMDSGQCSCRNHLIGRQCSDVQPGFFCAALDQYKYEAEEAAGHSATDLELPGKVLPQADTDCVQHLSEQLRRHRRHRRLESLQQDRAALRRIRQLRQTPDVRPVHREHSPNLLVSWTGPGFARVKDGAGLVFTVDDIPHAMEYDIMLRYEPESTEDWEAVTGCWVVGGACVTVGGACVDVGGACINVGVACLTLCSLFQSTEDWEAVVSVTSVLLPSSLRCGNLLPTEQLYTVTLPHRSRLVEMPRGFCFEPGNRYVLSIRFQRHGASHRHLTAFILVDSLVLVPRFSELPGFSGDSPEAEQRREQMQMYMCLDSFLISPTPALAEMCSRLVCSISAIMHDGALSCGCDPQGSLSGQCDTEPTASAPAAAHLASATPRVPCPTSVRGTVGSASVVPGPVGGSVLSVILVTGVFPPAARVSVTVTPTPATATAESVTAAGIIPPGTTVRGETRQRDQRQGPDDRTEVRQDRGTRDRDQTTGQRSEREEGERREGESVCQCNGHADACHGHSGECQDCRDHTTGHYCERCVDGYYGNPVLGSGEHCRPCPCPGAPESDHFNAVSCYADRNTDQIVCSCKPGYTGPRCDACAPGHFGAPSVPGGQCESCQCNGNIDPLDPESCDPSTGACLKCLYHTTGHDCGRCQSGYYGDARAHDCRRCTCVTAGTLPSACADGLCHCDPVTGGCPCRSNVEGKSCDRCSENHWNYGREEGCETCSCDPRQALGPHCNMVRLGPGQDQDYSRSRTRTEPGPGLQQDQDSNRTKAGAGQRLRLNYGREEGCETCSCDPRQALGPHCNMVRPGPGPGLNQDQDYNRTKTQTELKQEQD